MAATSVVGAIVVAAGRSERMGGVVKPWAPITDAAGRGRPLLAYPLAAFQACAAIDGIVLVVAADAIERAHAVVREEGFDKVRVVVPGGGRRQDSVRAGLDALDSCDVVVVHDGARPLVTRELIERGIEASQETGAACCAIPAPDTVKEADDCRVVRTLDRSRLWLAQTPQVFRYDLLIDAHGRYEGDATDDASMLEALGVEVRLYQGSPRNLKVTTPDDLDLVQALVAGAR
jgi:2-C-methyl-D-erythritol 4-phosphate cytidylyltransferase